MMVMTDTDPSPSANSAAVTLAPISGIFHAANDPILRVTVTRKGQTVEFSSDGWDMLMELLEEAQAKTTAAEARTQQVRQHRESLLRHFAAIERKFVPSTRWRAVPLLERAERVGVLKEPA